MSGAWAKRPNIPAQRDREVEQARNQLQNRLQIGENQEQWSQYRRADRAQLQTEPIPNAGIATSQQNHPSGNSERQSIYDSDTETMYSESISQPQNQTYPNSIQQEKPWPEGLPSYLQHPCEQTVVDYIIPQEREGLAARRTRTISMAQWRRLPVQAQDPDDQYVKAPNPAQDTADSDIIKLKKAARFKKTQNVSWAAAAKHQGVTIKELKYFYDYRFPFLSDDDSD